MIFKSKKKNPKVKESNKILMQLQLLHARIDELEERFDEWKANCLKDMEEKLKQMTFVYTNNLDDTKAVYLKKYVEQRLDGMQYAILALPKKIMELNNKVLSIECALAAEE